MLPLMNEIDKRAVEEINEEHNSEKSNLVYVDPNPVIENDNNNSIAKDINVQNHHLPEEGQFPTIFDNFSQAESNSALPVDISKIKIPTASEIPSTLELSKMVHPVSMTSSVNIPEIENNRKVPSQLNAVSNIDHLNAANMPKQMDYGHKNISSVKSKTKPKRYLCEICTNKGFTTKYSLKRHTNNFHKFNKSSKLLIDDVKPSMILPTSKYSLKISGDDSDNETDEFQNISESKKLNNLKRSRDFSDDETDEFQTIPDSKKLKARGLKRNADPVTLLDQHLPRKSTRIESYKRKNQWTQNSPAKRLAIQKGQGFSNWVNF